MLFNDLFVEVSFNKGLSTKRENVNGVQGGSVLHGDFQDKGKLFECIFKASNTVD